MLAIFDQTVAKSPEGLKSPDGHVGAVSGVGPLLQLFASSHDSAVLVNLGSPCAIAYDCANPNPFLPMFVLSLFLFLFLLLLQVICLLVETATRK